MKVRDVLSMLFRHGWVVVAVRGSHRQLKHPTRPGKVTVSGRLGAEMPRGTLGSVLRQAGMAKEDA